MSNRRRNSVCTSKWILLLYFFVGGSFCLLGGCQSRPPNLRGEGFHDEFAAWGEKKRTPDSEGDLGGFSTKAQQIERNLGVR